MPKQLEINKGESVSELNYVFLMKIKLGSILMQPV